MSSLTEFDPKTLARWSRRSMLHNTACGFGALATTALANQVKAASGTTNHEPRATTIGKAHFPPRAKRIIFLFMQGGVSQVDSFDHKPQLAKRNGEAHSFDDARMIAKTGKRASEHRLMQSPWKFKQYGECGHSVSELFSQTAKHVDDLCFLHGMHTNGVAHGPATLFLHCGSTNFVRPSFGSWTLYGLGPENADLPGFVSIAPSIGNGGPRNYGNAFLPARFQGTPVGSAGPSELEIANLTRDDLSLNKRQEQMRLIQKLNATQMERRATQMAAIENANDELDAVVESYEMAWRMQQVAPEVFDLNQETQATQTSYGLDRPETRSYGQRCLLARRLCEAGVRFIQVNYGDNSANPAWDQHSNLPKHATHAAAVDQPIAALLADLKQRGLLEDTIVWWGSEFGRTPYSQSNGTGRDHNPGGFTTWVAGGGFQRGMAHGATDEFGFAGVEGKVHMHDLHATLLHQLGLDHKQLTFRHAGRDFRLTDVYGNVVQEVLNHS